MPRIRTISANKTTAQPGTHAAGGHLASFEAMSPLSIVSDESIYYSDTEWQDGSPHHPAIGRHLESDLREAAVGGFDEDEQTLVDKLAAWWHGFSLLGDGDDDDNDDNDNHVGDNDGVAGTRGMVTDEDGAMAGSARHPEQQRRLQPHRVSIVEEDADSLSASLSCVSFSKKRRPLRLSRVSPSTESASQPAALAEPGSTGTSSADPPLAPIPSASSRSKRHTRSWANPVPSTFYVRSKHYMTDKVKLPAQCSLYRMVKVESVTLPARMDHIAVHLEVPQASTASIEAGKLVDLPPILIIQLQMPMYSPILFGEHDGESCSLIYYSELDPDVAAMPQHAIDLAVRFVQGGTEEDGQASRDRLKLIPRIMNVDEWGREAGLSGTEVRLVHNYNGKPLLMRPQFKFHGDQSRTYFEVDVDIHNYAYVARRAFCGYVPRLGPSVFENGFVIQGNNERELPEVLLTACRVYRTDFRRVPRMSI